jgi:hypothetical protein
MKRRLMLRRRLRRGNRGVAAVVGTLLALLVFLSIFGIFVTEYVPLWMTDNEEAFSNTIASQFGAIKQTMDTLYVSGKTNFAVANPVAMASNGVPVFAQPTEGVLTFTQASALYTNVTFRLGGSTGWFKQNFSSGTVRDQLGDRYYVPMAYSIEGDSVVQTQTPNQQLVLFQPSIIANYSGAYEGPRTSLFMTLFSIVGNSSSTSTASTGVAEVYTTYLSSQSYSGAFRTPVFMNFSTYNPCAWSTSWNHTSISLNNSGYSSAPNVHPLPSSIHYPLGACSSIPPSTPLPIRLYFPPVATFVLTVVTFQVNVGVGNPT